MPTSTFPSRRELISTAGLAAAALAMPALGDTAASSTHAEPRLPLLILNRGGLGANSIEKIRKLSPQIDFSEQANALADANVIFGGISENDVARAKKLRWIQFPATGVEGILSRPLIESEIVLTNAQGCFGPEIAEHAFGLLFALTRGIGHHAHERKWGYKGEPIELRGMTMGIIGLGGIGREIARRAKAMDMKVIAVDAEPLFVERYAMADEIHLVDDGLDSLLERADVVAMCAPHTAKSRGMLGESQFAKMKQGGYFINVSRGKTIQTPALVAALKSGHLAGAGLDVTDPEPLPDDHELWQMPNVIITSHIAGRSQFGRQRVENVFVENVHRYINNLPLLNVVDKRKGY